MQLKQFLFLNALLYISCVLTFKSDIPSTSTATSADTNEERNSEEATVSSSTKLFFTNKNDFIETSEKLFALESTLTLTYIVKMTKASDKKMNKFIVHIIFGKSIDKEDYDRENAALIKDIKTSVKHLLHVRNISYDEHKINSMAYRIFQRVIDFHVFYFGKLSIIGFTLKEKEHTIFWLEQISNALGNTHMKVSDYYIRIKERLDNDSIIKDGCDVERIHNMALRILQFLIDLLFVDSSAYKELLQIP
ncbi:hypothetical protein HEP_00519600 [Hepatocystis sp. ex Piliocolobus tephrosceles]|nr:hypothetical protein HEP_00519600 [Hepatocystis sp. ex Piliocolobus tephrosceles]